MTTTRATASAPTRRAVLQEPTAAFPTVTVPMPDHRLTLNRVRTNPAYRVRLVAEHKDAARLAGLAALGDGPRPHFPPGARLVAWVAVERRKRGQVWDVSALIEALKPTFDGLNGLLYADDRQLVGFVVEWDRTPIGTGVVHITLTPMA